MALRNIFKEGSDILRRKARIVTDFDQRLHVLLDDMKDTMHQANGVGLAAPQVGICRRAVVIEPEPGDFLELVNPVITSSAGEQIGMEGCLSVPSEKNCRVLRPMFLTVDYADRFGTPQQLAAEGWKAKVICHELDHLDGILFIDKPYLETK